MKLLSGGAATHLPLQIVVRKEAEEEENKCQILNFIVIFALFFVPTQESESIVRKGEEKKVKKETDEGVNAGG